ncbi:hypothetical protein [Pseudoroseomonas ludipueritiae]|nr:hypothetical protein [Pseudoroseomonas ludipueritiae]
MADHAARAYSRNGGGQEAKSASSTMMTMRKIDAAAIEAAQRG